MTKARCRAKKKWIRVRCYTAGCTAQPIELPLETFTAQVGLIKLYQYIEIPKILCKECLMEAKVEIIEVNA